ncbi:hypothetical protein COS78_03020 [Candidatus Shapirobacteria bacterium CG06_land_8_20_14_3_00_40_12]|uniref:HTH arsR-type domain-containing protein n=1 Tax=Candidatus Shapirobacteria bacterium CG06_land_8_20_14_3_00_40_12 TaxID=1974881 RepID=A0A2M7ARR6_9BACT|nr:MAG: hypothetical protein COS78_03020 [Candidatus Shapirobacteria bacterium CG06_land_8_20_14_3_00_40_12]
MYILLYNLCMDNIYEIIKNEKRRKILVLLTKKEIKVGEIVKETKLSQPQVSMILKELRDLKLVECKVEGKERIYKINMIMLNSFIKIINEFIKKLGQVYDDEIIVRR